MSDKYPWICPICDHPIEADDLVFKVFKAEEHHGIVNVGHNWWAVKMIHTGCAMDRVGHQR